MSQAQHKKQKGIAKQFYEPGKYFISTAQKNRKESPSNFGLTWEIFHIISLKESLMK